MKSMMNKLAFTCALLLITVMFIGCYTQLAYYEAPRPVRQKVYNRQEEKGIEREQNQQAPAEEVEGETDSETEPEDEGYYGHRKPTYDEYAPYYDNYYPAPYPYPYYQPYYSAYPYYGYRGPYYGYYGDSYGHYGYASPHYGGYLRGPYRTGDFHRNTPRSRSYRGVESRRSSSQRPRRSMENDTSNPPPAASSSKSSGSRFRRLGRSGRRH